MRVVVHPIMATATEELLLVCFERVSQTRETEPDESTAVEEIEDELSRQAGVEVPSSLLGEMVMDGLKPLDRVAYVRFASVYRNFQDIEEFQHFVDDLNARQRQEAEAREQEELPLS